MTDREMVVAAAEKVMGWDVQGDARSCAIAEPLGGGAYRWRGSIWPPNDPHIEKIEGWNPLESIADAWMLVEAMMGRKHYFSLAGGFSQHRFNAFFERNEGREVRIFSGAADTAPRAIVMACLRAVGVEI